MAEAGKIGQERKFHRRFFAIGPDFGFELLRRLAGGFMGHARMRRIKLVLEKYLPVRLLHHAEAIADDLRFLAGRAVNQLIESAGRLAEMGCQIGAAFRQIGEPEPPVIVDLRRAGHVEFRIVEIEIGTFVFALGRHAFQLAVQFERPGVVRAIKMIPGIAFTRRADLRTAMRAPVVKNVYLTVLAADHDDRLASDLRQIVIARVFDLAFMTDINPGALENALHFEIENFRIGIGLPVRPVGLHQSGKLFGGPGHDRVSICLLGIRFCDAPDFWLPVRSASDQPILAENIPVAPLFGVFEFLRRKFAESVLIGLREFAETREPAMRVDLARLLRIAGDEIGCSATVRGGRFFGVCGRIHNTGTLDRK